MYANARVAIPPSYSQYVQNYFVEDGAYVPRPGLTSLGVLSAGNDVQGVVQFNLLDGTRYLLAFCNADMYEYDEVAGTWSVTDLGTEGVTMAPSGDLAFANSRGRLIVTDGVNLPWMLEDDGAGGWTFTVLTEAPIANRCVVYYDKVFFYDIPNAENEFEWSDEGLPTDGYAADDQAWTFAQTDAGRIRGMAPFNDYLDIFKEDSCTYLMGSVEDTFQTDAVREGINETQGTIAGGSVVVLDGDAYLLSQEGPKAVGAGQQWVDLNEDPNSNDLLRDFWSTVDRSTWHTAIAFRDLRRRHVGWLVPTAATGELNTAIVYCTDAQAFTVFKFDNHNFTAATSFEDQDGDEFVVFGDEDGEVFLYGNPAVRSDAGSAISFILRSRNYGRSTPHIQKRLVEVMLRLDLETDFDAVMSPSIEGEVQEGIPFGLYDRTGKYTYRRGFNDAGYYVGWELAASTNGQAAAIEAAVTMVTGVSMHANWGG